MRRLAWLVVLGVFLLPLGGGAQGAESTTVVRVPADQRMGLQALRLEPILDLDYGSFRWLELVSADFDSLRSSRVTYSVVADARQVRVMDHAFDPLVDGEPQMPLGMEATHDLGFRLVQLQGPAQEGWLETLAASGARVLQYYPHNTYLVWSNDSQAELMASAAFVRWQGRFHPGYKINHDLQGRDGRIANVDVMFYSDGKVESTLATIRGLGGRILQHYPSQPDKLFWNAIVQLDSHALADVARISEVLWLGFESSRPTLDDEMSSQIVAGNYTGGVPFTGYLTWLAGLGLGGSGVVMAVIDTGADYNHPDLNSHIAGGYSFPGIPGGCDTGSTPGNDCSGGGHGTHVAGIMGGDATGGFTDGSGFFYGQGMAPLYGIFAMNSLSAPSWPPVGGWQEHSKRAVLGTAIGGNNSWTTGEGTNHGYQASERTHDIMVRDGNFDTDTVAEPFIEVFSAGNSGASGLTAPKEGKNLIVTASSNNFRGGNIDSISSFSSRGPAVDGRWVPTVAAPGATIASSRSSNSPSQCSTPISGTDNLYSFCSGTSMAAPHVTGSVALLTEWWRGRFEGIDDPSPAMAKALLVNSAVDMGTADRPNIDEGWGRIHLPGIVDAAAPLVLQDQQELFTSTGQQFLIEVGVVDPSEPLRVSVAWSDAPGAVGANPALVNNLDLTVETGGDTYLGNQFSAGWSVTGGAADTLNNLENVFVTSPGGSARIIVDATAIGGDGVPYNGFSLDQDFALVCYNCLEQPDFTLDVSPSHQSVCAPADGVFQVDVGSILSFSDQVTLSVTGEPAGTSASFGANPLTPPDTTNLTIGNTGAATPGTYMLEVTGTSTTNPKTRTVDFSIFDVIPATPTLQTPADGATNVDASPTFTWTEVAGTYTIEIATDASFVTVVDGASGLESASFTPGIDLETSRTHFWRVWADNACGTGSVSETWSFTTEAAPGDCAPGTVPEVHFFDDLEGDTSTWATGGTGSTWAISSSNTHSGVAAFWGEDVAQVSDQYLVTPPIDVSTAGGSPTLQFWNHQTIEDGGSGCYDGAVVEISDDGGNSWTRLEPELLTDPYDGPVDDRFSNPLATENAWCGDPQDWLESIVDIGAWAGGLPEGAPVHFRFRLATDSSVGRSEGWKIDDIKVQSCVDDTVTFSDGFESGDASAWTSTIP